MINFIKMIALTRQQRQELVKNFSKLHRINERKKVS